MKYTKKYWVSELCKITNKFNTSRCIRSISSQRLAENMLNRASILLSNRMQSFSVITNSSGPLFCGSMKRCQFFHSNKLRRLRWHFTRTAVPFEISILEKCDGKRSSFLEWKNWHFSFIHRKQKWTRTVTLIYWRLPYCLNVVDYPGIDFVFMQDSAPSYHAKATQQFLRQNTPDFIAADEWTSYSPDLIF